MTNDLPSHSPRQTSINIEHQAALELEPRNAVHMLSHRDEETAGARRSSERRSPGPTLAESTERQDDWTDPARTIGFSDAVFAIIITLLVLDLLALDWDPGRLFQSLVARWPTFVAYGASYLLVGVAWINHASAMRHIRWMDRRLQWVNLAVLFATGLLPFPTAVLAEAMGSGNLADERSAVVLYGAIGALASLSWLLFFQYMSRHPALLREPTQRAYFAGERAVIGGLLYLVGAVLGVLVSSLLALAIFVALPIFFAFTSEGLPMWLRATRRGWR